MFNISHKPFNLGFTLSELLVSLAVLGLIAGISVPQIVLSVDRSKNKAVLQEAFKTISDITNAGVLNGDFANITDWNLTTSTDPKGIVGYISSKLNYVKQCETADTTSGGCTLGWPGQPPTSAYNAHNARWILANGAKLQSFHSSYFNSSWMLWTITSKADGNMRYSGTNPDMTIVVCNVRDTTQVINGLELKSGMCGPWAAGGWQTYFNTALGLT